MKISAVVPVYNTEKYVGRCIDSIRSQTFTNWELILVDDGSTDGSLAVLNEYKNKDKRITVIHQNNSGPGVARNRGIECVTGDYTVFIDSDDVIKKDYFEKLSNETADIVFIDIDQVDEHFNVIHKEHLSDYRFLTKDSFIRGQMTGKILWGGVRKAARTDLLKRYNIGFSEHKIGEEAIYSFMLMHYAKSFSFIKDSVYEYVNREGSQSDTKSDDPWGVVVEALKEKVMQMDLYETYANTINAFQATATIVSLDKMAGNYGISDYYRNAKNRVRRFKDNYDTKYPADIENMPGKAKALYPFLKLGAVIPVYFISNIRRSLRK